LPEDLVVSDVPSLFAVLGLVVPAATGLGGYYLSGRNEEARDVRADVRTTRERRAVVQERLADERYAFQRDLLLELQDLLLASMKATLDVFGQGLRNLRDTGRVSPIPWEITQTSEVARVSLQRARERVLDDDLRATIGGFDAHTFRTIFLDDDSHDSDAAETATATIERFIRELSDGYVDVNKQLGASLRAVLGREPVS
jgi:hypothetical protein